MLRKIATAGKAACGAVGVAVAAYVAVVTDAPPWVYGLGAAATGLAIYLVPYVGDKNSEV